MVESYSGAVGKKEGWKSLPVRKDYYLIQSAIKHTSEAHSRQGKHLLNPKFKEIVDYKYGKKECACVLYNGKPFIDLSGNIYLNIFDFVKELAGCKDVKVCFDAGYDICTEIRD